MFFARISAVAVVCAAAGFPVARASAQASFLALPLPEGNYTEMFAFDCSSDGRVVVGAARLSTGGDHAVIWTPETGTIPLVAPAEWTDAIATSVSPDGSFVTGYGRRQSSGGRIESFVWRPDAPLEIVAPPDADAAEWRVTSASADGQVLAGYQRRTGQPPGHAVRWVNGVGEALTPEGYWATGISPDGSAIVGTRRTAAYPQGMGMVWRSDGSFAELGVPAGYILSHPMAVAAQGSVVFGEVTDSSGVGPAFRWTPEDGMERLGFEEPGDVSAILRATSADGTIVGGDTGVGERALIWRSGSGLADLNEVLASEFGLDLDGYTLREVSGISDDGSVLVGFATLMGGPRVAFVVQLPTPGAGVLMVGASTLLAARRRRGGSCGPK